MGVTLRTITKDNWRSITRLSVAEDQRNWVAPNVYSLAEWHFEPDMFCKAIYHDEEPVGFCFFGRSDWSEFGIEQQMSEIRRLMISQEQQGKGYGRAAMLLILDELRQHPDCTDIYISYVPGNAAAEKLYLSLGFLNEGLVIEDEIVLRLPVKPGSSA